MKRPFTDKDLNAFLKDIEAQKAYLFQEVEQGEVGKALQQADEYETAFNAILHYEKNKRPSGRLLQTADEARDYIEALKAVYTVLTDKNTPEDTKGILEDMNLSRYYFGVPDPTSPAVQAFFDMREELPEDHPILFRFIEDYIEALVYYRFYKAKDEEIQARGEDPEDYDDNSPEGLKRANNAYSEHFNDLCREYGLNSHIRDNDEEKNGYRHRKPPFSFLDKRPQDYIDEVYGERIRKADRVEAILSKAEEIQKKEGLTEDEALKRLSEEERDLLADELPTLFGEAKETR